MSYKQKRSFSQPSRGLGDSIEKFTKATGIKSVVNKVSNAIGKDCGCDERRDSLNRIVPYKRK
jgi:hypothetical protein